MEIFKQIKYSNYYISNIGNVYSIQNSKTNKVKPLSQKTKNNGYKEVCLYLNKKPKMFYVHRLVAEYFIDNIPNGYNVNHKDGDKSNNKVSNLEIVTPSENRLHSYNVLGNKAPVFKGEKHPRTKLTKQNVTNIRFLYDNCIMSTLELHEAYKDKISLSALRKICYRSTWKHI